MPLLLCSACGPTVKEIGVGVVLAMPLVHVITLIVLLLFLLLWRRLNPSLSLRPGAQAVTLALLAGLAAAHHSSVRDVGIVGVAVLFVGASTLTCTLLGYALLMRDAEDIAFAVPPILVSGVTALIGAGMASGFFGKSSAELFIVFWGITGLVGWAPLIVVPLGLWIAYRRSHDRFAALADDERLDAG